MSERIALGFCNNVDYEILWDSEVLEDLVHDYRIRHDDLKERGAIQTERDLVVSILGFMQAGAGGERFVSDSILIERFASRFNKKITLGGTSVRAAIAMRKLGYTSALHLITQNQQARERIPADCPYVCSNAQDSFFPHLIVQYGAGDRVRAGELDIRARQPNRLIYHCNADRIAMKLNPDFADLLAGAQVLLISGFNAMQSKRLLLERLATLSRMLERLPSDATVYLEDGGYYDPSFRRLIYRALGPRIDVYGLNEDELQTHLERKVELGDARHTRIALDELRQRIPAAAIVLHTRSWALAHGERASQYEAALRSAVTLATTRFCYGDDFRLAHYRQIESRAPSADIKRFADAINSAPGDKLFCVPVPQVRQDKATTVGLGDAFVGGFLPALLA
ncbi:MAG: hypothetical protein OXG85_13535 [Chloroflexi bacterium]|nr:hypothetical protein [Chloroflexota bacterium]